MNHVERFRALMDFKPVDRLPMIEWADYWDKTIDRWHAEGLPADLKDRFDIRAYFGLDPYRQYWIRPKHWEAPNPAHYGAGLIANEADYEAIHKYLYRKDVFNYDLVRRCAEPHQRNELVVWLTIEGFFWYPRTLFGIERHLYAFYDRPALMHRMNEELVEFHLWVVDEMCKICKPDFVTFAEDMSYNHGPMLSKDCFDEFMAPYYRRITPVLREQGIVSIVDSDGDVTKVVPWFEEVGVDGVLPLERQAGVDLADIRTRHPRFRFIGHFDKMVMKHGEEAMGAEFERLLPVMRQGGFIPSVDHQTPPDVCLEHYRVYLGLLREYCQRAAKERTP